MEWSAVDEMICPFLSLPGLSAYVTGELPRPAYLVRTHGDVQRLSNVNSNRPYHAGAIGFAVT